MKFAVTFAFLVTTSLPVLSRDIYVEKSVPPGNGSQALPFSTIQEGINAAHAGDTIKVGRGVFREKLTFPRSGKPGAPIVVEGSPASDLSGGDFSGGTLLEIHGKSHITIDRMRFVAITQPGGTFIRITGGGTDVRIQNCYFGNRLAVETAAIDVIGNDRRPIQNLVVDNIYTAELQSGERGVVSLSGNVAGFLIKDGTLSETVGFGIKIQATKEGSPRDGTIQNNRITPYFRTNAKKLPAAIHLDGSRDIRVTRNKLYFFGTGIEVAAEKPGSIASNIVIRRNGIERNVNGGIRIGSNRSKGVIRTCLVIDNLLIDNAWKDSRAGQVTIGKGADISILKNSMKVEGRTIPLLVSAPGIMDVDSDYNHFQSPNGSDFGIFIWEGQKFTTFVDYQKSTGQDQGSKISRIH